MIINDYINDGRGDSPQLLLIYSAPRPPILVLAL